MRMSFASSIVSTCLPASLSYSPKYRQYTISCWSVTPLTSDGGSCEAPCAPVHPTITEAASAVAHTHAHSFPNVFVFIAASLVSMRPMVAPSHDGCDRNQASEAFRPQEGRYEAVPRPAASSSSPVRRSLSVSLRGANGWGKGTSRPMERIAMSHSTRLPQ